MHGVVGAGNHQLIAGVPAAGLVGQFKDAAVGQHVDGNEGLRTDLGRWGGEAVQITYCYLLVNPLKDG